MIDKEEFITLILSYYEQNARMDKFDELFSDSFGNPILDWGFQMFDQLIAAYFTEEGVDWVNYYLYENPEKYYCLDEVKMPLEAIDDLWNTVEPYRK